MKPLNKKIAELSLMIALEDWLNPRPGRLRGLLASIKKAAEDILKRLPAYSHSDLEEIGLAIDRFERLNRWTMKKHTLTYVSFLAAVAEKREYTKITDLAVKIVDYYERDKKAKQLCFMAGVTAAEKWEMLT